MPIIAITIVNIRKAIKNIIKLIKKYKTPIFTLNGHIGNKTINNINITKRIK